MIDQLQAVIQALQAGKKEPNQQDMVVPQMQGDTRSWVMPDQPGFYPGMRPPIMHVNDTGTMPQDNPGMMESIARFMSGGRDQGQRALYNTTRAGAYNSATVPDEARPYGGLLPSLKQRRHSDMFEAQDIADTIRGQGMYGK